MNFRTAIALVAALGLTAGPSFANDPGDKAAPEGAKLVGKVVFSGKEVPKAAALDMSGKPEHAEHCMKASDKMDRSMVVDPASKGIANVFVELRNRKLNKDKWKPADYALKLDQVNCRFDPHVMVVPVGVGVTFLNSDPFMHNVNFLCKKNTAANFGIPEKGEKEIAFKYAEKIAVRCDVHTWMNSWVVATDNKLHALTAADGTFTIENIPPGEYEIRMWHETLGQIKKKKFKIDGETKVEVKHDDGDWKS